MEAFAKLIETTLKHCSPKAMIAYAHDKIARFKSGRKAWPLGFECRLRSTVVNARDFCQLRLALRNYSPSRPVDDLRVAITAVELISAPEGTGRTALSGQFTKMPLHIERGQQGMRLSADDEVEIWLVEHRAGEKHIAFRCSEPERPYCEVPVGEYRVKIAVTGQGIKTLRESYRISATVDGTLQFAPE